MEKSNIEKIIDIAKEDYESYIKAIFRRKYESSIINRKINKRS